jgi:hypothetical protein
MAIAVLVIYLVALLLTLAWATHTSDAAGAGAPSARREGLRLAVTALSEAAEARCEALTAALREIAELRLDESLDAPLAQARARREMHEIAAVALATSEQAPVGQRRSK